jgi:alkylation response protein AidB-like acyl-CoA dehydrogenase
MFNLTEEHLAVREAARQFAQTELKPGVIERDTKMQYPYEQVRKMAELGFLGMMVPPEYGGGGMDTLSYVLAMEEISKVDSSCSVIMSVNNSLVCWGILEYGNEEQKQKYLPCWPPANGSAPFACPNPKPAPTPPASAPPPWTWATTTC